MVTTEDEALRETVIEFVSRFTGLHADKLTPQSRLNYEVGMDGDDAADFFRQYRTAFGVELGELELHWEQHFSPEGMSLSTGATLFGPPFIVGFVLTEVSHRDAPWVWFLGAYAIWWLLLWAWIKIRGRDTAIPVTIEDLIEAIAARKWAKAYPPLSGAGPLLTAGKTALSESEPTLPGCRLWEARAHVQESAAGLGIGLVAFRCTLSVSKLTPSENTLAHAPCPAPSTFRRTLTSP
jgi:hypothetical protein